MQRKMNRKRKGGRRKAVRRGGQTVLINRSQNPIPDSYVTKMKFCYSVNGLGGPANLGYGNLQMAANAPATPTYGTVSHQPYGWDTFASMYNRYRAIRCSYVIQGSVNNGAVRADSIIGVLPGNEGATITGVPGINEFQENPKAKFMTQYVGAEKTLTGSVYIPKLCGRTKAQYMADDRYQATTAVAPLENAVLNIFYGFLDGTQATATADLNITLEYTVEFFDRKKQIQS